MARVPKTIAMFASRACRNSVMIGTALSQTEMEKIVRRLGDLTSPWNCPHGRPTIRSVATLGRVFCNEAHNTDYFKVTDDSILAQNEAQPSADNSEATETVDMEGFDLKRFLTPN